MEGFPVFETREQAQEKAASLRAQEPAPPHDDNVSYHVDHVTEAAKGGGWRVVRWAGWKAWIGGKQYGDLVTVPPNWPISEVWPVLREHYQAVERQVNQEGHGELVPPDSALDH